MAELYLRNVDCPTLEPVDNTNPLPVTLRTAGGDEVAPNAFAARSFTPFSITTQTTTTVKSGAGKLGFIVIPTPVASATVKVFDNTAGSGTVLIDTITFPAALLSSGPVALELGLVFLRGLTIVTAGATMSVNGGYI